MKKMKCCEYGPWRHIQKTLFSSQVKIEPNMLECYNALGCQGLPLTNALAYLPTPKLRRKLSVVNTAPGAILTKLYFLHKLRLSPIC